MGLSGDRLHPIRTDLLPPGEALTQVVRAPKDDKTDLALVQNRLDLGVLPKPDLLCIHLHLPIRSHRLRPVEQPGIIQRQDILNVASDQERRVEGAGPCAGQASQSTHPRRFEPGSYKRTHSATFKPSCMVHRSMISFSTALGSRLAFPLAWQTVFLNRSTSMVKTRCRPC